MAYKSLYRKYRPSKFEDVYGQEFIIKTLNNAIENNKISHAYLFTGTRGTGKTTIAKIFAKAVNCLESNNNLPCGKCEICMNENTDEIPDIIEIDAASNNGVDEIRELKNKIKLVPSICKYKVYIIDEVHMLSTGAFNALLKTLEEPPSHVIFILATTEPQKLPITIISRCQRFDFKKISTDNICARLKYISDKEHIEISDEALIEISKMSDGAMRDAIGTLDQVSSYTDGLITIEDIFTLKGSISSEILVNLVKYYINRDFTNMLDIIEKIYIEGKNFNLIVEDMLMLFRNMLIYKKAKKYFESKNLMLRENIIEFSEILNIDSIENIIIKLEELSKSIKESNYPRILFEIYLLNEYEEKNKIITKEIVKPIIKENNVNIGKVEKTDNISVLEKTDNKEKLVVDKKDNSIKFNFEGSPQIKNKDILINNTIALASNKNKKVIQEHFTKLDKYLIEKKYATAATILKDATVAAVSEDHILLTFKYSSMVENHDEELNLIKELLYKMTEVQYKIVAITEDYWLDKRPYYIELKSKNGKIELIEEKLNQEEKKEQNKNQETGEDLIDMFGSELVEMEG